MYLYLLRISVYLIGISFSFLFFLLGSTVFVSESIYVCILRLLLILLLLLLPVLLQFVTHQQQLYSTTWTTINFCSPFVVVRASLVGMLNEIWNGPTKLPQPSFPNSPNYLSLSLPLPSPTRCFFLLFLFVNSLCTNWIFRASNSCDHLVRSLRTCKFFLDLPPHPTLPNYQLRIAR